MIVNAWDLQSIFGNLQSHFTFTWELSSFTQFYLIVCGSRYLQEQSLFELESILSPSDQSDLICKQFAIWAP